MGEKKKKKKIEERQIEYCILSCLSISFLFFFQGQKHMHVHIKGIQKKRRGKERRKEQSTDIIL
jgi:hypothetical protein